MMIWFAGILQNTSCNKTCENKTNQKTLSCECGVFFTITRFDWHYVTSVRFTANTQITNFSFQVLVRRKSLFFNFLDSTSIFLLSEWKHIFLGAPSQDRTSVFPCYWTTFLDAFLKKRMAAPMQLGSRKGVLNAGKKFVIELYVIRSWWKIKFKNKREIHQLVFSPLH